MITQFVRLNLSLLTQQNLKNLQLSPDSYSSVEVGSGDETSKNQDFEVFVKSISTFGFMISTINPTHKFADRGTGA